MVGVWQRMASSYLFVRLFIWHHYCSLDQLNVHINLSLSLPGLPEREREKVYLNQQNCFANQFGLFHFVFNIQTTTFPEALVWWLWEKTHIPKVVVGLNPGTVYQMEFFSHIFVAKICNVCLKRPKINKKEAGVGPFKKKLSWRRPALNTLGQWHLCNFYGGLSIT